MCNDNLIIQIERILKSADDELIKLLIDSLEINKKEAQWLLSTMNDMEDDIYKIFKADQKRWVKQVKGYVGKAYSISALLAYIVAIMEGDNVDEKLTNTVKAYLMETAQHMTAVYMDLIDREVVFNTLSPRTLEWVDNWSQELGQLLKVASHDTVANVLKAGIKDGKGIEDIALDLSDSLGWSRTRARRVAITEVLTANSVSQYDAYRQSPSVQGKKWKHSGGKGITPRPAHVALDGHVETVDEPFHVNGHAAQYPRDTSLPASERVHCHCAMGPVINDMVLALNPTYKNDMRDGFMEKDAKDVQDNPIDPIQYDDIAITKLKE